MKGITRVGGLALAPIMVSAPSVFEVKKEISAKKPEPNSGGKKRMQKPATRQFVSITLGSAIVLALLILLASQSLFAASVIHEYSLPIGTIVGDIVTGPDGNLWMAASNAIWRITPSGQLTSFPGGGSGITVGPDQYLWFTDGGRIGRMSTSGTLQYFPLPFHRPVIQTAGITTGPDGNLWFCEYNQGYIVRMTTAGEVAEFRVTRNYGPLGIVPGPDGNLWFTINGANQIGRITTTGAITLYTLPASFDQPAGIAPGPDGNLWFTSVQGNIGRITTQGVVTSFPIPKVGGNMGSAEDITLGPDGNLWFTVWYNYPTEKVGRITTSGKVTLVNVPTSGNGAYTITKGPDGNLWFTEAFAYKIGVLAP